MFSKGVRQNTKLQKDFLGKMTAPPCPFLVAVGGREISAPRSGLGELRRWNQSIDRIRTAVLVVARAETKSLMAVIACGMVWNREEGGI